MAESGYRTGKICYIEIPTDDIERSKDFYRSTFGWSVRQHGDGSPAFDDTVGQVSGTWVLGRQPTREPGLVVHIMVANAERAGEAVVANGGEIIQPVDPGSREVYFLFRDPAGNVLGVYEQEGLEEAESKL
ncbi:MAG TPA: glyoxalase [Chloroflexi bacterium]|jgi:predicted enzyme related to lactoylglutathione lyase|nr:glyoxalase [Chloroflexota bacterium]